MANASKDYNLWKILCPIFLFCIISAMSFEFVNPLNVSFKKLFGWGTCTPLNYHIWEKLFISLKHLSAREGVRSFCSKKFPFYASKMCCCLCCCCHHFLMFLIEFREKSFDKPTFILSSSTSFVCFFFGGEEKNFNIIYLTYFASRQKLI